MTQIKALANVLSIAGSDPSGGAGIQGDLKTFAAMGCYGMAAISALTVQNTLGVIAVELVSPAFLAAQIDAIFADIRVDAVKIGMLGAPEQVQAVAAAIQRWRPRHVVVDPVLAATQGVALGASGLAGALVAELFPLASLVTPNLPEARVLAGLDGDAPELAARLQAMGAAAVLVKGGHAESGDVTDYLADHDGIAPLTLPRLGTRNSHGTGCTLASAIAAGLAAGLPLRASVGLAREQLHKALAAADQLQVGSGAGHGPLNHFVMQPLAFSD
ncbi:MAG: bifunctional hydroxymethylpyrimidine kinase/phosphomethylpyrimidine kinase [Hyphomicrobiales bacterium]|nr:bifunctional hydroxymethylpyrimidine kinase/phosphomethylpyrimidine kinase [Hyphomicrobiales bacterium]